MLYNTDWKHIEYLCIIINYSNRLSKIKKKNVSEYVALNVSNKQFVTILNLWQILVKSNTKQYGNITTGDHNTV